MEFYVIEAQAKISLTMFVLCCHFLPSLMIQILPRVYVGCVQLIRMILMPDTSRVNIYFWSKIIYCFHLLQSFLAKSNVSLFQMCLNALAD
jgi:hypothetical protein